MLAVLFPYLVGGAIGGVLVGMLANRKPEWFAKVVKVANAVDDKVNDTIKKS